MHIGTHIAMVVAWSALLLYCCGCIMLRLHTHVYGFPEILQLFHIITYILVLDNYVIYRY